MELTLLLRASDARGLSRSPVVQKARTGATRGQAARIVWHDGPGHALAEAVRHGAQEHRLVQVHVVVGDDDAGLVEVAEVAPPSNLDRIENAIKREGEPRLGDATKPPHGTPARPFGELVFAWASFSAGEPGHAIIMAEGGRWG